MSYTTVKTEIKTKNSIEYVVLSTLVRKITAKYNPNLISVIGAV